MTEKNICPQCGHLQLIANDIEIRNINPKTKKIHSSQQFTEWECSSCGWIETF